MRRMHVRLLRGILAVGLIAVCMSQLGAKTYAANFATPSSNGPSFAGTSGSPHDWDIYYVVANTADTKSLTTVLHIYYPATASSTTPVNIKIDHADVCNDPPDYQLDGQVISGSQPVDDNQVDTIFTAQGSNSKSVSGHVRRSSSATCQSYTITGLLLPTAVDPVSGRKIVTLTAQKRATFDSGDVNGTVNVFRVYAPGGWVSMTDYTGIELEGWTGNTDPRFGPVVAGYEDYNVPLGTSCNYTSDVTKQLTIYDVDNTTPSIQPAKFSFSLFDETAGTYVYATGTPSRLTRSGVTYIPDDSSNYTAYMDVVFKPGHKYQWRFHNVYTNNTLRLGIPFDSAYHDIACPSVPTGNVDDISCPSTTLTGTAVDPDRSSARLNVGLYVGGQAPANYKGTFPTDASHRFTIDVSAYVAGGATPTFYVHPLGVNSAGVADGQNSWLNPVTYAPCSPAACAGLPAGASGTKVSVTLDDQTPSPNSDPGTYSTTPSDTYHQYLKQSKTVVTAIEDDSAGGDRIVVDKVGESYQKVVLDYAKYVNNYPYDINIPKVTYDSYYDDQLWVSSSTVSTYACNTGDSGGGSSSTCTHSFAATVTSYSYSCPVGGTVSGTNCIKTTAPTGPSTCPLPSYWIYNRADNRCYYTYRATATPATYSCPYGTLSGSTCSYDYSATPLYKWSKSTLTKDQKASASKDGPTMNPCYDRGFRNVVPTSVSPQFDDNEDPSRVTFTSNVSVGFYMPVTAPRTDVRDPMRVKINVSGDFYVLHPNGSITRPWPGAHTNGVITAGASEQMFDSGRSSAYPMDVPFPFTDIFSASVPPLAVGDKACFTIKVYSVSGRMKIDGTRTSSSGSAVSTVVCSSPINNQPYFKVYNGDAQAGAVYAPSCSGLTNAKIEAFNKGPGGSYRGSGSQIAALATGAISQFVSADMRPVGAPTVPIGLTLANDTGSYGGSYGASPCIPDYWSGAPAAVPSSYAPSGVTVVNPNETQVHYVQGDAYIKKNVIFSGMGAWNLNSLPSYWLIVKGNIYIDPSVTELDGVYVALPNGASGGRIYTCAPGGSLPSTSQVLNECGANKLTVYGAFIADQVKLLRTQNSLRNSTVGELSGSSNAAEVFVYTPEIWLQVPDLQMPSGRPQYDWMAYLPPVL